MDLAIRIMLRRFAVIASVILAALSIAAASPFAEAAKQLDGEWRGDGFVLKVDSKRAQASIDASHPFSWQRFLVKEVAGEIVVFTVGAELFQVEIDADTLTLTGTAFRGERRLRRAPMAE